MTGSEDDKKLWRKFKEAQGSAAPPPPPLRGRIGEGGRDDGALTPTPRSPVEGEGEELLIAAWLDGRLSESERASLEARLADEPELLDIAVSAARSKDLAAPWPKRAQARAAALVVSARPSWNVIAAAAAAMVIVALGGFQMGQTGSELLSADSETDLAAELGFLPETDLMETLL